MNDFSELEAELRQLRPAPVSLELSARIESELARVGAGPTAGMLPRPTQRRGFWWTLALGLPTATALILLGLGFFSKPQTPSSPTVAQKPASAPASLTIGLRPSALSRVVVRQEDEDLVFSPNQSERLLRRVRYDTRETMQWRNPQTGASLRVSYPAEQVVLTPVSFQ
jgi:hypothetical protein